MYALESFDVKAKYVAQDKEFPWLIKHSNITTELGNAPAKSFRKTTYRYQDLAAFVADILLGNPGGREEGPCFCSEVCYAILMLLPESVHSSENNCLCREFLSS